MEKEPLRNKLVFHPRFNEVVSEISKLNISLPPPTVQEYGDFPQVSGSSNVFALEDERTFMLNPHKIDLMKSRGISAYDESKNKFMALEGSAYGTSHSLVVISDEDYIPSNFITFKFYTRSKELSNLGRFITYCDDPESESNKDYHLDRNNFLLNNVPTNSLLFIDGPLIGGQATSYANKLNAGLLKKGVLPIFFVKNSLSNLVVDKIEDLKSKYNSDLHWANKTLKVGQRTCFFKYLDNINPKNTKIFCYIKGHKSTSQRIELHPESYEKYKDLIPEIMNVIYYLMLVQGNPRNPQVRPIAIAEMYARATLRSVDFTRTIGQIGITPTMNQERGFTQ